MGKLMLILMMTGLALALGLSFSSGGTVLFRSLESKTEAGAPVFNRVSFKPGWREDVWEMRQSHVGLGLEAGRWDRLAIVVDKASKPAVARFYQLAPGGEPFERARPAPLKARCFACHANGPRAIRPELDPAAGGPAISWGDRLKLGLWNIRIKAYGRVQSVAGAEPPGGAPFRAPYAVLARPLALRSCVRCHSESGLRNPLLAEHAATARFLVERGRMPPFPFRVSPEDREALARPGT